MDWLPKVLEQLSTARTDGLVNLIVFLGILVFVCLVIYKIVPSGWLGKLKIGLAKHERPATIKNNLKQNAYLIDKFSKEKDIKMDMCRAILTIGAHRAVFFMFSNGDGSYDGQISFLYATPYLEERDPSYPSLMSINKIPLPAIHELAAATFSSNSLLMFPDILTMCEPDVQSLRKLGTKAVIIVPIRCLGATVGMVNIEWLEHSHSPFTQTEIDVIEEMQTKIELHVRDLQRLCMYNDKKK